MQNLNLSLQELFAISRALKAHKTNNAKFGCRHKGVDSAIATIDKAMEECDIYEVANSDDGLEVSVNLTLCISNPTEDIRECKQTLMYLNCRLGDDSLSKADRVYFTNSVAKKEAELQELMHAWLPLLK